MGKGKGLLFSLFAALGAITGYAGYMANQDEFSEETKNNYNTVIKKFKNVGNDVKRTYISIGNKKSFAASSKSLGENAKKAAINTGELVKSASIDMYNNAKKNVLNAVDSFASDTSKKKKNNKKKKPKNHVKNTQSQENKS